MNPILPRTDKERKETARVLRALGFVYLNAEMIWCFPSLEEPKVTLFIDSSVSGPVAELSYGDVVSRNLPLVEALALLPTAIKAVAK